MDDFASSRPEMESKVEQLREKLSTLQREHLQAQAVILSQLLSKGSWHCHEQSLLGLEPSEALAPLIAATEAASSVLEAELRAVRAQAAVELREGDLALRVRSLLLREARAFRRQLQTLGGGGAHGGRPLVELPRPPSPPLPRDPPGCRVPERAIRFTTQEISDGRVVSETVELTGSTSNYSLVSTS
ncbi:unnamed protein product [Lampetra fluviatilis]